MLRTATAADAPGAARLLAERGEPADAVDLGRQRELMAALFPPRTADLLTYYVPI